MLDLNLVKFSQVILRNKEIQNFLLSQADFWTESCYLSVSNVTKHAQAPHVYAYVYIYISG